MKKLKGLTGSFSTLLRPSQDDSPLHHILAYALKGPMLGALTLVIAELFLPGWVPINRVSMATMLLVDIILGEVTLALFYTDLSWSAIIPLQCVATMLLAALWIFIIGGQTYLFSTESLTFFILFFLMYVCAWLVIYVYSRLITEQMNKRLNIMLNSFKNKNFEDNAKDSISNDDFGTLTKTDEAQESDI